MDKKEMRKYIREVKKRFSETEKREMSEKIWETIVQNPVFEKAKIILAYWSLPDEVDTHQFVREWAGRKTFLLPCVRGEELELRFFDCEEKLCPGEAYCIPEPAGEIFTDYEKIDLILVPGMAFDRNGNRLGRGKGYYDRILRNCKACKIGVCFPFQLLPEIPTEPHDIKVDLVVEK